jgi:hypothetical protein
MTICNNNNRIFKFFFKVAVKWLIIYDLKVYRGDIIFARVYIVHIIKTQFRVNYIIMYNIIVKHVRRL